MQALIITCLLCLKTPNPCDSNLVQPFTESPDCSKCLTDLRDHFNLPADKILDNSSTEPVQVLAKSAEDEISPGLKENLESLLVDLEVIAENLSQNPNELKDLINKMKTEINQELIMGSQSHENKPSKPSNAETLKRVQKQEHLLEKINERFGDILHQSEALKEKLKLVRGVLSLESNENNKEETKKRRDTVMYGERLMVGEELVSKNGKWKFVMDKESGDSMLYDNKGNLVRKSLSCDIPKPIPSTLHIYMNHTLEYYLDMWHGKSANLRCLAALTMPCADDKVQCYLKLDDDGHMKFFLPSGEPSYTYF